MKRQRMSYHEEQEMKREKNDKKQKKTLRVTNRRKKNWANVEADLEQSAV